MPEINARMNEWNGETEEYPYQQVNKEENEFYNLFATGDINLEIATAAGNLKVSLSAANSKHEGDFHIFGKIAEHSFLLSCDQGLISALLGDWFAPSDLSELPKDLQLGVLESALQPTLNTFLAKTGKHIECESISFEKGIPTKADDIKLGLSVEGGQCGGEIAFSNKTLPMLLDLCNFLAPKPKLNIPEVQVSVRICVADVQLTVTELQSLEAGDILFLDWQGFYNNCFEMKIGDNAVFEAFSGGNKLTLGRQLSAKQISELAIVSKNREGEMFFRINVELPEKEFSVKTLMALRAGQAVTSAPAINDNFLVRIGDDIVGRCELVAVANRAAARLLAIGDDLPTLVRDNTQAPRGPG